MLKTEKKDKKCCMCKLYICNLITHGILLASDLQVNMFQNYNQAFFQVGFCIQGICFGILLHSKKQSKRK